jgi:hypothetical protein
LARRGEEDGSEDLIEEPACIFGGESEHPVAVLLEPRVFAPVMTVGSASANCWAAASSTARRASVQSKSISRRLRTRRRITVLVCGPTEKVARRTVTVHVDAPEAN